VVEVSDGIFYEYKPPSCVYEGFFQDPKMIVRRTQWRDVSCADPNILVASAACCKRVGYQIWENNFTDVVSGGTCDLF
jgi:hypothetical protein